MWYNLCCGRGMKSIYETMFTDRCTAAKYCIMQIDITNFTHLTFRFQTEIYAFLQKIILMVLHDRYAALNKSICFIESHHLGKISRVVVNQPHQAPYQAGSWLMSGLTSCFARVRHLHTTAHNSVLIKMIDILQTAEQYVIIG